MKSNRKPNDRRKPKSVEVVDIQEFYEYLSDAVKQSEIESDPDYRQLSVVARTMRELAGLGAPEDGVLVFLSFISSRDPESMTLLMSVLASLPEPRQYYLDFMGQRRNRPNPERN